MVMTNNAKYAFKDILELGFPYRNIHPYKQKAVQQIIANIPEWVTHVIIFGSAVTPYHFWWDDLDVCVIGQKPEVPYRYLLRLKDAKFSYDFVEFDSLESLFLESNDAYCVASDIVSKGVLVYERAG